VSAPSARSVVVRLPRRVHAQLRDVLFEPLASIMSVMTSAARDAEHDRADADHDENSSDCSASHVRFS
jgi:hypothetical protein